jgi:hypothetical protein
MRMASSPRETQNPKCISGRSSKGVCDETVKERDEHERVVESEGVQLQSECKSCPNVGAASAENSRDQVAFGCTKTALRIICEHTNQI